MSGPAPISAPVNVPVQGGQAVVVVAYPAAYFDYAALALKLSGVDHKGAARYKGKKVNVPGDYVTQLQADLIELGYLPAGKADGSFGGPTKRAVLRFQRHATRPWRMPRNGKPQRDATNAELFTGAANGECDHATAQEVRKWITNDWALPFNRFPQRKLSTGGKLRDDAALLWEIAIQTITELGGTLAGPYAATTRPLVTQGTEGSSEFSYHYTGRAVDLKMGHADPGGQRYFIAKEANPTSAAKPFWRIYCKTEDQENGTQGTKMLKGAVRCWRYANSVTGGQEYDLPEGYYIDLTAELAKLKFERVHAHAGWEVSLKKQEWWHFQYSEQKEATFLDECELAGVSAEMLRASGGWQTDAELDHVPG